MGVLLLAGILGILFWEDWRLGLAFMLFSAASLTLFYRIRHFAAPYWGEARAASANLFGFIEERLNTMEDVTANGAGVHVLHGLYERTRQHMHKERRAGLFGLVLWMASRGMLAVGNVMAYFMGATLFWSGAFTLGTVYLLFHYTEMLRFPLDQMLRQLGDLQRASASIARVQELMEAESCIVDGGGAAAPIKAAPIAFQNVSFAYGDGPYMLHQINFALQPGRTCKVIGHYRK